MMIAGRPSGPACCLEPLSQRDLVIESSTQFELHFGSYMESKLPFGPKEPKGAGETADLPTLPRLAREERASEGESGHARSLSSTVLAC